MENRTLSVRGAESPPQRGQLLHGASLSEQVRGALNSGLREWTKGEKKKITGHLLVICLQSCVFSGHIFVEIFAFQFNRCLVESKRVTVYQLSFYMMPTSQYQR